MFLFSLRNWLTRNQSAETGPGAKPQARPRLEMLEERDCPAVFNVLNGDVATLINDIYAANANNQANTINLAAGGTYILTSALVTSTGDLGLPTIQSNGGNALTINGNGSTIERSTAGGTPSFRILQDGLNAQLIVNNTTIANGLSDDAYLGAGINVGPGGVLSLNGCAIINNVNGGTGSVPDGGGIGIEFGAGAITIVNCTISGNRTLSEGGGDGGGIEMRGASGLTISQSTIANNSATGDGGGVDIVGGSAMTVFDTIVAGNTDANGATDIFVTPNSTVGIGTSIVPSLRNTGGTVTGSPITANPLLGPLQNNGGSTMTQALLAGSPAIDAASPTGAVAVDQRGVSRPQGNGLDIGAFEVQLSLTITGGNNQSTTVGAAFPSPLAVQITSPDWGGAPVPNETVTFTIHPVGGAGGSFTSSGTVTSDANGRATVSLTANSVAGTFTVTASIGGSSLTFTLTNSASAVTPTGSAYQYTAYIDAYEAYVYADSAYTTGNGSYATLNNAYSAFYYAYYAYYYSTIGATSASQSAAYYAYYYSYLTSVYAYDDYLADLYPGPTTTYSNGRRGYSSVTTTYDGSYSYYAYYYASMAYIQSYLNAA